MCRCRTAPTLSLPIFTTSWSEAWSWRPWAPCTTGGPRVLRVYDLPRLVLRSFSEGSHELRVLLGGLNTAVLLCSSLFMALAVHAAQHGRNKQLIRYLIITELIGALFLGIKFLEYYKHYKEHLVPGLNFSYPGDNVSRVQLFMVFYFILTGMHAVHMLVGLGVLSALAILAYRGRFSSHYYNPVDIGGLYWHFVDIVWVFIFPLLYLVKRTGA